MLFRSKDNYKMVGKLMAVLFPHGVPKALLHGDVLHLFTMKLGKLSRFANSGLTHIDSIHDDAVYSAIIESCLRDKVVSINGCSDPCASCRCKPGHPHRKNCKGGDHLLLSQQNKTTITKRRKKT